MMLGDTTSHHGASTPSLWYSARLVAGGGIGRPQSTGVQTAYGISFEPLRESSMIKFTVLVVRRPDITAAQFHRRWLIDHGSLAKRYLPLLRVHRYVQSHVIDSPSVAAIAKIRDWTSNPYDGIVEAWWGSEEEMAAGFASKEAQEASEILAKDEQEFCDSGTTVFLAREYELFRRDDFEF
jgi:EthD domain